MLQLAVGIGIFVTDSIVSDNILMYLSAIVIGSIISSTILKPNVVNGTEVEPTNETLQFCGANDCPGNNVTNPNLEDPDSTLVTCKIWVLHTILQ